MQDALIKQVKRAVSKSLGDKNVDDISLETKLHDDLGLDSISSLTFLMTLEQEIEGFTINPATLDTKDLESIQSIVLYIEQHTCTI